VLLHEVNARTGSFDLTAGGGGYCHPALLSATEIDHRIIDVAVELAQLGDEVVDRLQVVGIGVRPPGRHLQNVVTGPRL
jgi:hypothetical protein